MAIKKTAGKVKKTVNKKVSKKKISAKQTNDKSQKHFSHISLSKVIDTNNPSCPTNSISISEEQRKAAFADKNDFFVLLRKDDFDACGLSLETIWGVIAHKHPEYEYSNKFVLPIIQMPDAIDCISIELETIRKLHGNMMPDVTEFESEIEFGKIFNDIDAGNKSIYWFAGIIETNYKILNKFIQWFGGIVESDIEKLSIAKAKLLDIKREVLPHIQGIERNILCLFYELLIVYLEFITFLNAVKLDNVADTFKGYYYPEQKFHRINILDLKLVKPDFELKKSFYESLINSQSKVSIYQTIDILISFETKDFEACGLSLKDILAGYHMQPVWKEDGNENNRHAKLPLIAIQPVIAYVAERINNKTILFNGINSQKSLDDVLDAFSSDYKTLKIDAIKCRAKAIVNIIGVERNRIELYYAMLLAYFELGIFITAESVKDVPLEYKNYYKNKDDSSQVIFLDLQLTKPKEPEKALTTDEKFAKNSNYKIKNPENEKNKIENTKSNNDVSFQKKERILKLLKSGKIYEKQAALANFYEKRYKISISTSAISRALKSLREDGYNISSNPIKFSE
jgi:hypothetical protein